VEISLQWSFVKAKVYNAHEETQVKIGSNGLPKVAAVETIEVTTGE